MHTSQTIFVYRLRRFRGVAARVLTAGLLGFAGSSAGGTYDGPTESIPKPAPEQSKPSGGGGGGGFSFGIDLTCLFTGCGKDKTTSTTPGDAAQLAKSGPKIPDKYSMSGLVMQALVKGGAPFVIDYDARQALLRIEMKVQGSDPFVYNLKANGPAQKIFRLPESFGAEPRAAVISVRSVKDQPGAEMPAPLRINGMGMGEKAVGSVAIDQVSFGPPEVRIGRFGKARYSFHSRSDFNKVVAEFARLENRDGIIQVVERVYKDDLGELTRDTWIGRDKPRIWDGKGEDGEVSKGLHVLNVRAWRSSVKEGDWVVSWSPDWVDVKW
ncbi:hypothetical protein [Thiobacillus denitrificans]|uniref:hypothetical protein n=1 Tax=Thiobacillus denitrificans TaxID=36861 RepID=UPI00036C8868|nr:hypothetical protein [Thiobacillus denitrificans]